MVLALQIVSMLTNAAAKIFENTDKEYKMGRTQVTSDDSDWSFEM